MKERKGNKEWKRIKGKINKNRGKKTKKKNKESENKIETI